MSDTDFGKIDNYANFVINDPFRNGLHYPAVLNSLGDIQDKKILDVGCGDGFFTRMMASLGGKVVGYDKAEEKIIEAKSFNETYQTIQYEVATPQTFRSSDLFDYAVSVLVLSYANSLDDLRSFFTSTFNVLKPDGVFVSVVFNPNFKKFNEKVGTRNFVKLEGDNIQVNFLNPQTGVVAFTSVLHQFNQEIYESLAHEAGFTKLFWSDLYPTESYRAEFGDEFWSEVIESQPYSLLVVQK